MDIRRLEVFCKLMETGSFSRTAQELGLTQPTVSGHIKSLERDIGLQLFDRRRRQIVPTGAAEVLLGFALKILELRKEAGFALEKFRGRISGRLRMGGSTIPGAYILPALIGRFRRIHEDTQMSLVLGDTVEIAAQVAAGHLELGVVGAFSELEGLSYEPLLEDQMVLAAPTVRFPGESSRKLKVSDLVDRPFIIREEGSGTRTVMLRALAEHDLSLKDLNVVAEMGSTEAVRHSIKAGLGVSILSRVAVAEDVEAGHIEIIPVDGLDLKRSFFLVTDSLRSKSPLGEAFIEFLRNECRSSNST